MSGDCLFKEICPVPRSPILQCFSQWLATVSALLLLAACAASEPGYNSGQVGPVDCKDFRIQSVREDLKPPTEKSCIIARSNEVQINGSGYIRTFVADSSYMLVILETLSTAGHYVLPHTETQGTLLRLEAVKTQATDWQDLPALEINGYTYRLARFRLSKFDQDCIGFLTFGGVRAQGYVSRTFGYSCKKSGNGKMDISDIRKDLEGLRVWI
jgi:hypothetical protein